MPATTPPPDGVDDDDDRSEFERFKEMVKKVVTAPKPEKPKPEG